MSIVRETCRCGASVEFDEHGNRSATTDRLTAFRRDHRCATETTGVVQPEAITSASGAAPVPDPDPTCACGHPATWHAPAECVSEIVGTTVKVLQRLMPRHGIDRRGATKRNQRGEANHLWRGDAAGYQAVHLRVAAERGKPSECSECGRTDDGTRYEWANLTGAYHDTSDYARMCVSCHRRYDAARRRLTGERTSPRRGGGGDV